MYANLLKGFVFVFQPTCDNHDDEMTPAIILCNECGNLCADCDKYLHLQKKTRIHQRQVDKMKRYSYSDKFQCGFKVICLILC